MGEKYDVALGRTLEKSARNTCPKNEKREALFLAPPCTVLHGMDVGFLFLEKLKKIVSLSLPLNYDNGVMCVVGEEGVRHLVQVCSLSVLPTNKVF